MDYRGFFIEKFPHGEGFDIAINQDHPALKIKIMKILANTPLQLPILLEDSNLHHISFERTTLPPIRDSQRYAFPGEAHMKRDIHAAHVEYGFAALDTCFP